MKLPFLRLAPATAAVARAARLAPLVVLLAACGTQGPEGGDPSGASSSKLGATGGVIELAGDVKLEVPAGALGTEETISISQSDSAAPAEHVPLSPLFDFGPDGITFAQPVSVTLAFTGPGDNPAIYWSTADGGFEALPTTIAGSKATAQVTHFSRGFVGEVRSAACAEAGTWSFRFAAGEIAPGVDEAVLTCVLSAQIVDGGGEVICRFESSAEALNVALPHVFDRDACVLRCTDEKLCAYAQSTCGTCGGPPGTVFGAAFAGDNAEYTFFSASIGQPCSQESGQEPVCEEASCQSCSLVHKQGRRDL